MGGVPVTDKWTLGASVVKRTSGEAARNFKEWWQQQKERQDRCNDMV